MTAVYRFGRYELSPATRQLLIDHLPAPLGARAFDVLLALIERRDRLVTKNELLDLVWPGVVVEENNLMVQVSALRKLLGQDAIATVAGRGYRFTLEPTHVAVPPPPPSQGPKHNLPAQLASFIGRERELAEVRQLLARSRLVTLVGVGGIGKTQLSLQTATSVLDDYPDGAWFVELGPLEDAQLIPHAVASALGVKEDAGHSVHEALVKSVKGRHLLVVLDNCEHLRHACAELAKRLLQSALQLTILATSREHLNVAGEITYQVPSLSVPDPHTDVTIATVTEFEAVRLFIDRASAAQPTFQVTNQNAVTLANACRQLEGIPLAIELAAARVRSMSVEKVAALLSDRFRLLTGGDTTSLPHQQTLRASIEWSYTLLSESERVLLGRLAVFAGGWTLEAAQAVGTADTVDASEVLDLVTRLVQKSLVEVGLHGDRYRLLETVRQFAHEKLNESNGMDHARLQHIAFFLALAEEATKKFKLSDARVWLSRLDAELENFLMACALCERVEGGAELGLKMVCALADYWIHRGLLGLGYEVTVRALARVAAEDQSLAHCRGLIAAGGLANSMGRYTEARTYGEQGLAIARTTGQKGWVPGALYLLGVVTHAQGDLNLARQYLQETLGMARSTGNANAFAGALNELGNVHRSAGNLEAAETLYKEHMAIRREEGNRSSLAVSLANLAQVSIGLGIRDSAPRMLLEMLGIADELGSKSIGQGVLRISAAQAALCADWQRAARLFATAEAQATRMGLHIKPVDVAFLEPLIGKTREVLGAKAFAAADAKGNSLSYEDAMAEVRAWLESKV